MPMTAALRRPWDAPLVRRALLLSGLAAGLWLAGSAGSSAAADEPAPQPLAPLAAPVQDLAGGLLTPVTTPVTPVVEPVVEATVAPVVQTLAPVVEPVVRPVLRAVEPVTAPVVAVLAPVVEPVVVPVVPVLEPVLPPVVRDVVAPVPASASVPVGGSSVVAPLALAAPIEEMAAPAAPAAVVDAAAASAGVVVEHQDGAVAPVPAPVPGGNHLPMPRPAVPSGVPAVASGPSSPDQPTADVSPVATPVVLAALYAASDDARNAAADRALDPTFAPD